MKTQMNWKNLAALGTLILSSTLAHAGGSYSRGHSAPPAHPRQCTSRGNYCIGQVVRICDFRALILDISEDPNSFYDVELRLLEGEASGRNIFAQSIELSHLLKMNR